MYTIQWHATTECPLHPLIMTMIKATHHQKNSGFIFIKTDAVSRHPSKEALVCNNDSKDGNVNHYSQRDRGNEHRDNTCFGIGLGAANF